MATRALSTLKKYFKKYAYPTEQQFHDALDSFVHKDDKIGIGAMSQEVIDTFNNKAEVAALAAEVAARQNDARELGSRIDALGAETLVYDESDFSAREIADGTYIRIYSCPAHFNGSTLIRAVEGNLPDGGIVQDILELHTSGELDICRVTNLTSRFSYYLSTRYNSDDDTIEVYKLYSEDHPVKLYVWKEEGDTGEWELTPLDEEDPDYEDIISELQPARSGIASAIAGKADKVSGATSGNLAALDASGNLKDSGKKASDFARSNIYGYGDGYATIEAEDIMIRATASGFHVEADDEIEFSGQSFDVTTEGDVNVNAGGAISVKTNNGDMDVETTDGAINVTTNNGDMNVEVDGAASVEATGTLNLSSANGNANVTAEETVTVRAQTQDLNLEAGESVNVKAGENGDHNIKKVFDGPGGSTVTETYPVFGELLRERVEIADDGSALTHALLPNQVTAFTSRTSALTLTLGAGATHTAFALPKEYHFFIVIGDTAPTVTFPAGITWAGGAPTIAANKTYEFSIQEGVAIGIEA